MGKKSGAEGAAGGAEEGAGVGDPLKGLQPGDIVEGSVREIEGTEVCLETKLHLFICMSGAKACPSS